jgi:hypothetical protein
MMNRHYQAVVDFLQAYHSSLESLIWVVFTVMNYRPRLRLIYRKGNVFPLNVATPLTKEVE